MKEEEKDVGRRSEQLLRAAHQILFQVISQTDPSVEVSLKRSNGLFDDVLHISLERSESRAGKKVRKHTEAVITCEALLKARRDPLWAAQVMQPLVDHVKDGTAGVVFWQITSAGVQKITIGSGIVGMSPQFTEDLADAAALREAELSFERYLRVGRTRRLIGE